MGTDKLLQRVTVGVKGQLVNIKQQDGDVFIDVTVLPKHIAGSAKTLAEELDFKCQVANKHRALILSLQPYLDKGDNVSIDFKGMWSGLNACHNDQGEDEPQQLVMIGLYLDVLMDIHIHPRQRKDYQENNPTQPHREVA